jgi:diaminohydroxyphosphoribosylaminopyrimidine deaminase / 5-amino-6-(5-phosphoribosylamino)uracil reductase
MTPKKIESTKKPTIKATTKATKKPPIEAAKKPAKLSTKKPATKPTKLSAKKPSKLSTTSTKTSSAEDEKWMARALELARKGQGMTRPNPIVGAVVVRDGRVLAEGFHRRAGLPHAEREALGAAKGRSARGSTMYVTLEPCCHTGRTPPCTDAIIDSGVKRVVVAVQDPNPVVNGQGIARLRQAGIRVEVGCLAAEARALNRPFLMWVEHGRPWVTLKIAATLDGFIADWSMTTPHREPGPVWLTGETARAAAHALRAEHDAVLVGAGTVLADDPQLTVRLPGSQNPAQPADARGQPLRVVLDGRLRMAPTAKVLRGGDGAREEHRTLVFASEMASPQKVTALEAGGAQVVRLPGHGHRVHLPELLQELARRNVQSVLVEGGAEVHAAFISAGLVDAVAFFQAPLLLGGGVPIARGPGRGVPAALRLGRLDVTRVGEDICIRAEVIHPDLHSDVDPDLRPEVDPDLRPEVDPDLPGDPISA